jgi:flagellar basal body-associated protein FliL
MEGLWIILSFYGVQIIAVIVFILLGVLIYDKRFKSRQGEKVPAGFEKTEEINIDPVTNEKTRVYYNSQTGERFYKKEK